MLDHAFKFVETVIYHIGGQNIRSQKAIEKLGAVKVREIKSKIPDDNIHMKLIYELDKTNWANVRKENKVKAK